MNFLETSCRVGLVTQIDVHQFGGLLVNQNVVDVSVAQTDDVTDCGHKAEKLNPEVVLTLHHHDLVFQPRC